MMDSMRVVVVMVGDEKGRQTGELKRGKKMKQWCQTISERTSRRNSSNNISVKY